MPELKFIHESTDSAGERIFLFHFYKIRSDSNLSVQMHGGNFFADVGIYFQNKGKWWRNRLPGCGFGIRQYNFSEIPDTIQISIPRLAVGLCAQKKEKFE